MGDTTMNAGSENTSRQHGEHTDTIESVDLVFRAQRKLSFSYGGVFFLVTLGIPALTVFAKGWYATPIMGGMTLNWLVVSTLYFVFLWVMAWTYSKQADKLDARLMDMADALDAKAAGGGSE